MAILSEYAQLGFHTSGAGGNPTGIGDHIRALHQVGRPAVIVCVDGTVGLMDALEDHNFHEDTIVVWRHTYDNFEWMYGTNVNSTAALHWEYLKGKIPAELLPHKAKWWLAFGNEMKKEAADWVHDWTVAMFERGNAEGFKMLGPNWSAGTPEPESWRTESGVNLLHYLARNPKVAALGIHEYSYTIADLFDGDGSKVGRYLDILSAAQDEGIARPNIVIKEFGWEYSNIPTTERCMEELRQLYDRYPDYPPAGIWYLGPKFGNIHNQTQRLIVPTTEWLTHEGKIDGREVLPPTPPPGERCGDAREPYARTYYRVNAQATIEEWLKVCRRAFETKSTVGFSPDDAGIGEGLRSKTVIEVGGEYPPAIITPWYQTEYCVNDVRFEDYDLSAGSFTNWPTEHKVITQKWNSNPEYYSQWYGHAYGDPTQPLNGHGGIDIRAPYGSRLYSVWPAGEVTRVETNPDAHNFGIHVRVRHHRPDGEYIVIYAHLQGASVSVGQSITSGQVIGLADNTGNSYGSHLHLALKRRGATAAGTTTHPDDLVDPTPFLEPLMDTPPGTGNGYTGPSLPVVPLVGLHDRANRHPRPADHEAARRGGFNGIFIQTGITAGEINGYGDAWKVCRIFESFHGRTATPAEFFSWTRNDFATAYNAGIRHFVAGNEQNIDWESPIIVNGSEGTRTGRQFGLWLKEVHRLFRAEFPEAQFGWPALSPGFEGDIGSGWREAEGRFLDDATAVGALSDCDFITCHSYYANTGEIPTAVGHVRAYRERFPSKWVLCTEYGSPTAPNGQTAGAWAAQFQSQVSAIDNGTGCFYFLVSGAGWENWALVDEAGNDTGFISGMQG